MTTPSRARACVEQLAACAGALDERIERVDVRGTPDAGLRAELCAVARDWRDQGFGTFHALDALGDELSIDQIEEADGELRLTLSKRPTASTFYFLTPQGMARLLATLDVASGARRVLIADTFAPFKTSGCSYECWSEMVEDVSAIEDAVPPVPRRIVRDQLAIVPISIGPILLVQPPRDSSTVFSVWRTAACPQLLMCLCDEIWRNDGEVSVTLTGPRRRRIAAAFDAIEPERDHPILNEVAEWIYNNGRDIETRHTLFVYELAREWPDETPFSVGFASRAPGSLEAAKTDFRMHVRDASKETLKSLQDLRKALVDDVGRLVAQTRELSGTIWRDLLVVLAAVLGRFSLLSSSGGRAADLANWILIGLALYLFMSIGITAFSNYSFMKISQDLQEKWKTKLYGFVDPKDFDVLAAEPMKKAERVYRYIRNAAFFGYALTIVALLALSYLPNGVRPSSTSASHQNATIHDAQPSAPIETPQQPRSGGGSATAP